MNIKLHIRFSSYSSSHKVLGWKLDTVLPSDGRGMLLLVRKVAHGSGEGTLFFLLFGISLGVSRGPANANIIVEILRIISRHFSSNVLCLQVLVLLGIKTLNVSRNEWLASLLREDLEDVPQAGEGDGQHEYREHDDGRALNQVLHGLVVVLHLHFTFLDLWSWSLVSPILLENLSRSFFILKIRCVLLLICGLIVLNFFYVFGILLVKAGGVQAGRALRTHITNNHRDCN